MQPTIIPYQILPHDPSKPFIFTLLINQAKIENKRKGGEIESPRLRKKVKSNSRLIIPEKNFQFTQEIQKRNAYRDIDKPEDEIVEVYALFFHE